MKNDQKLTKERRKELKAPYRQKRESDSESCDKFIEESRQRQQDRDQRKKQEARKVEISESITNTAMNIMKAGAFVVVLALLTWITIRWTSDFTDSTQKNLSDIEECHGKLESRLNWIDSYSGGKFSADSKIEMLAQEERNEIARELYTVKHDLESTKKRNEIRKTRLSFGQYQCEADRISGRYEQRRSAEQRILDQERLERAEIEINAAMDDVLAGWKKKSVQHYVANGVGPRVDTFVMKDGSSVLCTTSFRNGIRAVSCNR